MALIEQRKKKLLDLSDQGRRINDVFQLYPLDAQYDR